MAQQKSNYKIRRTPLDGALAVFLLSAAVGVWASYDRQVAWGKFGLLAVGVALFYWLAWLPSRRLSLATSLLGGAAAVIGLYFLFTQDWNIYPADSGALQRLGLWWMGVRPQIPAATLHPNIAGGLIAALAPMLLFRAWYAWQEERFGLLFAMLGVGSLAAFGLMMTSSRAAWLALAVALVGWLAWEAAPRLGLRVPAWGILLGLIVLAGLAVWLAWPRLPMLLRQIPGAPSAGSRLELDIYTLRLVADYPYTGGGLAAFSGLYSAYIKGIPNFLYGYAHNLYLDIAVEQGLAGLGAWVWIWAGSLAMLARFGGKAGAPQRTLRGALLAGLLVMGLHGLVDDAFYGMGGTPLLFALPGLALAARRARPARSPAQDENGDARRRMVWAARSAAALAVLAGIILVRQPLLGAWYANLGAVSMARLDLAAFPTDEWGRGENMHRYAPAQALFSRALHFQPDNVTANYRLGLIEMLRRDYGAAVPRLQAALAADAGHRGVQKALGFSYIWSGA